MDVLILGIGNLLLQDEGVGVHVIKELQRRFDFPAQVELLDGGTAGMELVEALLDREQVMIIDAIRTGDPPGTLVELEGDQVPVFLQNHLTPHQLGLTDVLATLTIAGRKPERLLLFGIVPEAMELSLSLSDRIEQRIDPLIERLVAKLGQLGLAPMPRREMAPRALIDPPFEEQIDGI
jgi:hydrogenase maturation protease